MNLWVYIVKKTYWKLILDLLQKQIKKQKAGNNPLLTLLLSQLSIIFTTIDRCPQDQAKNQILQSLNEIPFYFNTFSISTCQRFQIQKS